MLDLILRTLRWSRPIYDGRERNMRICECFNNYLPYVTLDGGFTYLYLTLLSLPCYCTMVCAPQSYIRQRFFLMLVLVLVLDWFGLVPSAGWGGF